MSADAAAPGPGPQAPDLGLVMLAAAGALGHDIAVGDGAHRRTAADAAAALGLPAAERVCVVLVDGLGLHNLRERAEHAPVLSASAPLALRSALPSTTATNMAALGTGQPGGRTGMLGYTVRNPADGRLLNLISWQGGPAPETWQRCPTIFELLAQRDVLSVSVGPWAFEDSPLTRAAMRGAEYDSAESLTHRVDRTLQVLSEPDVALTSLYWGDVDHTGHAQGWRSDAWAEQLALTDAELGRLAARVPSGTLVLVTADHGMIDVPAGASAVFDGPARYDVGTHARLADGVELVAGEPRMCHLHTEPGAAAHVAATWRSVLGERAEVRTRAEAVAAGWFGPVAPEHEPLIGDVVAAMLGDVAVHDSRTQTEASMHLVGMHGSITPAERTVPLAVLAG